MNKILQQLPLLLFVFVLFNAKSQNLNTRLVKDILPGTKSSMTYAKIIGNLDDVIFISLKMGDDGTYQLWRSDGSAAGTYVLVDTESKFSNKIQKFIKQNNNSGLILIDDVLYFTDGTLNGTVVQETSFTGKNLRIKNDLLYYNSFSDVISYSISQKQSTIVVSDENFNSIEDYFIDGNTIYYTAPQSFDNQLSMLYTYNTDTEVLVSLLEMDKSYSAGPWYFEKLPDNKIIYYFKGQTAKTLYVTDGTPAGSLKLKEFQSSFSAGLDGCYLLNGKYYFNAMLPSEDPESRGLELFVSDGTISGTKSLYTPTNLHSIPKQILQYKGEIYFSATNDGFYQNIYKTDGTPAGTVSAIADPIESYSDFMLVKTNNELVFDGTDTRTNKDGLFTSNGTLAGSTVYEVDLSQSDLYGTDNKVYFFGYEEGTGRELYEFTPTPLSTSIKAASVASTDLWFPNPAKETISIKQNKTALTDICVYDMLGSKIYLTYNNGQIDVSTLKYGTYILQYTTDGNRNNFKFTKE